MNFRQIKYAGISASLFLVSIIPILQLQQQVLQYGFNNQSRDWIKGGCLFISWMGFTVSGASAFTMYFLEFDFIHKKKE